MRIDPNHFLTHLSSNPGLAKMTKMPGVNPSAGIKPVDEPSQDIQPTQISTSQTTSVSGRRIEDVVELESISFNRAQVDRADGSSRSEQLSSLIAGRVNRPISFGPAPSSSNHVLHRAYFVQNADHASLNAAAVERQSGSMDFEA